MPLCVRPLFFKVRGCSVYGLAVIDEPVRAQLLSFTIPQLGPLTRWKQRFFPTFHMKKETGSVSTVVEFVQDSGTAAFACGAGWK